jgi:hypothetical protein
MDDTTNLGEPKRVSLQQAEEIAYWTRRFGVALEQLQEAVRTVGNERESVEAYLRKHGHIIVTKV